MRRHLTLAAVAAATALVLSGCVVGPSPDPVPTTTGLTGPDGTTTVDDGGEGGDGGDPFPPDYPTDLAGWKARYQNLPWLSDDLDNNDYFITGTVDGHDVIGFFCAYDGDPRAFALGTDNYVVVNFQSASDIDVDVLRSDPYIVFTGIGTYTPPSEERGTSIVVPSFDTSIQVDSTPGKETSSPTTAEVSLEFLGVPIPDTGTCYNENFALSTWARAQFGY